MIGPECFAELTASLRAIAVIATTLLMVAAKPACAGISSENVIVVINADSHDSRTIANHYTELRNIPSTNVVVLDDVPEGLTISLSEFRSKILQPLLAQVNGRGLAPQTRVIAYSAGFPTSVGIAEHTARLTAADQKKYQLPTASLTGLTFFYQFVLADNERYLEWGSNFYARGPFERHFANPFVVPERRARFDEAIALRDTGQFAAAADRFEKLFVEYGTLAPLGILAAEARVKADDRGAARRLIERAIAAGWASGTYLDKSETLAPLMSSASLTALRPQLVEYPTVSQEPIGFLSDAGWTPCGAPAATIKQGLPYLMSCMLAVVHPRGSTPEQATQVLADSSESDSTFPTGAFWFTYTRDARTNPRFPQIGNALLWLKQRGHDAELIHAAMPSNKSGECMGLMLGTAEMPLNDRTWSFCKGAIADNLTSLSARFDTSSQTKVTEFLHAGAAMTCGPVYEPYNLPFKFPSPMMYAFYTSGVSAIEAFYLSIQSPYQQLIVGDPLARPFARGPTDTVDVQASPPKDGKRRIHFVRRLLPLAETNASARSVEILVEGRRVQRTVAVDNIEMSIPASVAGAMEVRTVFVGPGPIQARASHTQWLNLESSKVQPKARWIPDADVIELSCSQADTITLMHHRESLGTVQGESGRIKIDRLQLGSGPIRLRPLATINDVAVPGAPLVIRD